jgi:carbon monoxide dehydrogenase subunit G
MDISGSYTFNAPPQRVWDLLMDPAVIASCIPGCEKLDPEGEDRYRARLKVALAAITGSYDGTVTLSDKTPPNSYRLTVEGQGDDHAAARRREHDHRCRRDGGDRRHGRAPRSTTHRQRLENDAGQILLVPARKTLTV